MNDEIKKILDNMFHIIIKYEEDFEYLEENKIRYILSYNKMQKLYDYITNLQQIEQEHQRINGELRERIAYLERSNDRREDTILGLRQEVYEQEDYVKSLLQKIDQLTNNWNELRQHTKEYLEEWENSDDERVKGKCDMARDILYDMEEIKEVNK